MQDRQEGHISHLPEQRERDLPRFPATPFRISEAEGDVPFNEILTQTQATLEPLWRTVEEPVMTTFERVTRSHWRSDLRQNGIPITLTGIEQSKSRPLQLGVRDKGPQATAAGRRNEVRTANSLLGSLVHELGHNFMNASDEKFMMSNFSQNIDISDLDSVDEQEERRKLVVREGYTELLWKEVVDRVFPPDQVAEWQERRKAAYEGRVYVFLDTLSPEDKRMILDREQRKEYFKTNDTTQQQRGISKLRAQIGRFLKKE